LICPFILPKNTPFHFCVLALKVGEKAIKIQFFVFGFAKGKLLEG